MKISSNYYSNVNFGYDKKLNEELKANISSIPDKSWSKTLSDLNAQCNRLESIIRKKEKSKNDPNFPDYVDMFVTYKDMLTGFISFSFENLNFMQREYKHYEDEFIKNGSKDNDWRKKVMDAITVWGGVESNIISKSDKVKKDELFVPKFDEDGNEITKTPVDTIVDAITKKNLLEEFKPSKSSPKGFDDVAGMTKLKEDLNDGIISLIRDPQQALIDYEEYGKTIPRGLLLFGPPGCGKTYIAQALASEIDSKMYLLKLSKLGSHYVNQTSINIQKAFDEIKEIASKSDKPVILFMDEVDTLGFDRTSRIENEDLKQVGTMLQALDTAKDSNVIIIGATNKINILDAAVARRFESKTFVDVPDSEARIALLKKYLNSVSKGCKLAQSESDLNKIQSKLSGYSSDSICKISKAAALNAMHRNRSDIDIIDFEKAISESSEIKPDRKKYLTDSDLGNKQKIGF